MKNGASDMLSHYEGHGKSFGELLGIYLGQIDQELSPLPNNDPTAEDYEAVKRVNADLRKQAKAMRAAANIASIIYDHHTTDEAAAADMQAYEGNEIVEAIGWALANGDWSRLAI